MIGELLHRAEGHLADVPAFLASGEEVVDRATTDDLGVFSLASRDAPTRLSLVLDDGGLIELDLEPPARADESWGVKPARPSA